MRLTRLAAFALLPLGLQYAQTGSVARSVRILWVASGGDLLLTAA